jgi:DNA-binding HxlR family transcriptional regulator
MPSRTYGQFCALAMALDVIGDRWTLLIVRELVIRGPSRWTDLKKGLPGIAANLLADRIRELEENGIVSHEQAQRPRKTTLYALTARGRELKPVLQAINRWGSALWRDPVGRSFQSHWLTLPLRQHLRDLRPEEPQAALELRTGDEALLVEVAGGAITIRTDSAAQPDAVLSGPPVPLLALLIGEMSLPEAQSRGARYLGDPHLLERVRPTGGRPLHARKLRAERSHDDEDRHKRANSRRTPARRQREGAG